MSKYAFAELINRDQLSETRIESGYSMPRSAPLTILSRKRNGGSFHDADAFYAILAGREILYEDK